MPVFEKLAYRDNSANLGYLFCEGANVLFIVALAIFKMNEVELLRTDHACDVINVIRRRTHWMSNPDDLLMVAFGRLGFMTIITILKNRERQEHAVMAELYQRQRRLNPNEDNN